LVRAPIAKEAQAFMTTFPDMVTMDTVAHDEEGTKFHWTLTGTNTGPSGAGKRVRISGYELWKIDNGAGGSVIYVNFYSATGAPPFKT
jgi:hypothetical protein